jgi:hypothetical protein
LLQKINDQLHVSRPHPNLNASSPTARSPPHEITLRFTNAEQQ